MAHALAEIDTVVVDDPDLPRRPSRPSRPPPTPSAIADIAVQVKLDDGQWHRKAIGGLETACHDPQPINYRLVLDTRHESYEGAICLDGCFSLSEVAKSDDLNNRKRKELTP